MGGFFGTIANKSCVADLFYGTDYNSHLGTKRAGMATFSKEKGMTRSIHNIEGAYFRSKFEAGLGKFEGATSGIGIISDTDAQPIIVNSHLGRFAIVTVARLDNMAELEQEMLAKNHHFTELSSGKTNQTELIATLICEGKTIEEGVQIMFDKIKGSCSLLLLTENGIYAVRDKLGRTPVIIGKKDGAYAVSSESNAFPNLDYEIDYYVGPGEIVLLNADGWKQIRKPGDKMQVCSFFWVYFGFPCCDYEGINVDIVRNALGEALGKADTDTEADFVCGVPDSGVGHAIGYAIGRGIPYKRGILKYTPTWPRSFTPSQQVVRNLVAKMKLLPNKQMLEGKRVVFLDDSIVRGTQLRGNVDMVYKYGAKEVHMRIACPPLIYSCRYLNFSATQNDLELITRSLIEKYEGQHDKNLQDYVDPNSEKHKRMVDDIRKHFGLTTLKFNTVEALVKAIGLPKEKICTHCFDGSSYF
ncbi:MAG: amidophosphoribosyltransferase [Paludibacteraceae bacterium]|nr:amidophosphoribosyltransferase [Paludibacteraceae bacterium]